jgi:hypothetical protein
VYVLKQTSNILMYNFHVLSNSLLIYICKLHWNQLTHQSLRKKAVTVPLIVTLLVELEISIPVVRFARRNLWGKEAASGCGV